MNQLHNVKISGNTMVEMLMDRLAVWDPSPEIEEVYRLYYTDLIESDAFDNREFDVMVIVDNDWINYNEVMTPSEAVDHFELDLAEDVSDENMSESDFVYAVVVALENEGIGAYPYEVAGEYYIMTVQG